MKFVLASAFVLALGSLSNGQSCGRHVHQLFSAETYIVGGSSVEVADSVVSFQVFKSDEWWNDHEWKHVCGGALLNKKWILTAAHCVKEFREWGTARVSIGSVNRTEASNAEIIKVRRAIEHPKWQPETPEGAAWDIALIELQREARLNYWSSPACLSRDNSEIIDYESCAAVGWGRVAESSDFSESLKVVHVNLMTAQQCFRAYRNMNGVSITRQHICAGRLGELGKGICQGDLGGPLFCRTQSGIALVGVASNGALCGSRQYPGVYVRIDDSISWIQQTTKDWSIGERDSSDETTTSEDYTPSPYTR